MVEALAGPLPDGPALEIACGPSGSALLLAESGRRVTAVDASDAALAQLAGEASRRGLRELITLVHADLLRWEPDPGGYALVLCTGYWERSVFAAAAGSVRVGGVLAWEGLTEAARTKRPGIPAAWCLRPGEPATLLPASFEVLSQQDVGPEPATRRRLLAARRPARP